MLRGNAFGDVAMLSESREFAEIGKSIEEYNATHSERFIDQMKKHEWDVHRGRKEFVQREDVKVVREPRAQDY